MHYGATEAVAGIDLRVARGEIFAFLGPNEAGKTTTVEIHNYSCRRCLIRLAAKATDALPRLSEAFASLT